MRILVIGGGGFIGPSIVSEFRDGGHLVATFSRHGDIRGDRRDLPAAADALRAYSPDVVVDVILGSARHADDLVRVCRGVARRIVVLSSMDVYRACGVLHRIEEGPLEPVPLTEDSPLRTGPPYPAANLQKLKSVFAWLDDDYDKVPVERAVLGDAELAATVLRLPFVYGPRDRLHRMRPLVAHMDAGPADYVIADSVARWRGPRGYVDNVAHAVALAATDDRAAGRIYNVAEPHAFTEREWTERVARVVGWTGRIVVVPDAEAPPTPLLDANLAQHWSADSSRIRRELGYAEVVDVDDAIRRSVDWERKSLTADR